MKRLAVLLLLAACGSPKRDAHEVTSPEQELRDAALSVQQRLHWGCGLPAEVNNPCSGDGVSMAGRWLIDGGFDAPVWQAIKDSIDSDGRLWRNPQRPSFNGNSSSRDQLIGLVEATLSSKDTEPLRRVQAYFRAHRLCPGDNRCDVTPSVALLVKETLGSKASIAERIQDETTINAEAASVPATYQAYLVMRKLNIHHILGNNTPSYRHAAMLLKRRFPNHLFARYVDILMNGGEKDSVAIPLTTCLIQWKGPGNKWWGDAFDGCASSSQGHELVALAQALLRD